MNFPDCREGAAYDSPFDSPFATLGEVRGRKKVRTAPKATSRGPAKKEDANIASPPNTWERDLGAPPILACSVLARPDWPRLAGKDGRRSQVSLLGIIPEF